MSFFSTSTFSQSSRRPTMMVQTGPMERISRPSFSRRARPRSTASATASACGRVKETVALMLMPAIGGFFHGRNAGARGRNLHDHVGRQLAEVNGLLHDGLWVPIEARIGLDGKAAVAASLGVEDRLQQRGAFDGHLFHDLPADLILGGRGHLLDQCLDAAAPQRHLPFQDGKRDDGVAGGSHRAMLDGIGQFVEGGGVVPQAGGGGLRHFEKGLL